MNLPMNGHAVAGKNTSYVTITVLSCRAVLEKIIILKPIRPILFLGSEDADDDNDDDGDDADVSNSISGW